MKKIGRSLIAVCLVMGYSIVSHATGTNCQSTVSQVTIKPGGALETNMASIAGGLPLNWCSVTTNSSSYQFDTNACKALYALFLAASLSGSVIYVQFSNTSSCASQAPYTPIATLINGPTLYAP